VMDEAARNHGEVGPSSLGMIHRLHPWAREAIVFSMIGRTATNPVDLPMDDTDT
jgi:hypothetical protein